MHWVFKTLLLLLLPLVYFILRFQSQQTSVEDKIRKNRGIANFDIFHANSLCNRLQLRAGPNARLVATFGIQNSFTTTDVAQHTEFLRRAVQTINSADAATWCRVWTMANETANALLRISENTVNIERIARICCFDVVLELLFKHTRLKPYDIDHADRATELINILWQQSKKGLSEQTPITQEHTLDALHASLRKLVSGGEDSNLALIMPAYETLWRVVLLTYIHVAFRYMDAASTNLVEEVVEIVPLNLGARGKLHPTVEHFAEEALRLYPPTKRIYRESAVGVVAADVESMHHDFRIWGHDALNFRPSRFSKLTQDQKDAYMPFGVGRNVCPAINGFGRKMISSLVVVLLTRLGTRASGAQVRFSDDRLDQDSTAPLPTGRNDAVKWVLLIPSGRPIDEDEEKCKDED
ncbi:hypothetical protein CCUS01_16250 [Colletotrichum cuscutae]|uniref:Cytochrome P450 n=1 Tax=Colletotrichum cuscutae TaxID=1209917 RepID=A0AAI9Y679_9PEZI|nr:hypothetical protein CCUS01_16250 [Colletotrichum cuscutae]